MVIRGSKDPLIMNLLGIPSMESPPSESPLQKEKNPPKRSETTSLQFRVCNVFVSELIAKEHMSSLISVLSFAGN